MKKKTVYKGKPVSIDVYNLTVEGRKVRREIIQHPGAAATLGFDGVAFTEVFFPKKITMPTNWISNSIKNAVRSERLHVPIKQINR